MLKHESTQRQEFLDLLIKVRQVGREIIEPAASTVDEEAVFPQQSIDALKELQLLSAYVPVSLGGMGFNVLQIARICEVLGHYCGSTAMIYAMHQIQVACIVHHAQSSEYFVNYLKRLVEEQRLIASATTEIGVGGDLRSSVCAVEIADDQFKLYKQAPVISYGEAADDIVITARRHIDAAKSDQVQVLTHRGDYELEPISSWDSLGFRGTCSSGFNVTSSGQVDQILPTAFADILSQTMHPFAHITWGALWSGIAGSAVNKARQFVRNQAKNNIDTPPISSIRLGEVDSVLQVMRTNVSEIAREYFEMIDDPELDSNAFSNFGFGIRVNNLKISSSELIVDIVGKSMLICGISSYRNDSGFSLCRHIRDAYGAALMVNNDRIMLHNATLLLMHKEEA